MNFNLLIFLVITVNLISLMIIMLKLIFTALAGSKFSKLRLNILTTDDTGSFSGGVYTVYSKVQQQH